MSEPVLSVQALSVQRVAGQGAAVLRDVSFDLDPGSIVGVTGAGGSGKSTLAHALLGLTTPGLRITSGEVRLNGQDLLTMHERERRRVRGGEISLIMQNPRRALHPMLPIGKQIDRIWRAHRKPADANRKSIAAEILARVGINAPEERRRAFAHELSGGMAQRALIAMALSGSPRLLVADEPTSGLDVTVQAQLLDWLADECRRAGLSVLLVTQEPGILANYCERIIRLERGAIVSDLGCQEHFRKHPAVSSRVADGQPEAGADCEIVAEIADVVRIFPLRRSSKRVHAVSGVSLSIAVGETVALIGESGSGKTTVGRCLAGLESVTSGAIRFRDKPLSDYRRLELCGSLQFVRQDPFDSFDPRWPIVKSVQAAIRLHSKLDKRAAFTAAQENLQRVGLVPDSSSRKPREVSAGVLQKANIARALALRPELLILDEPTAVLAPDDRDELLRLLAELNTDRTLSCLLISHDLATVAAISDRVAVMYLGQVVELGRTGDVFDRPLHPYTRALQAAHLDTAPVSRRSEAPAEEVLAGDIPSPIDLPSGCFLASRCSEAVSRCVEQRQSLYRHEDGREVRCWRVEPEGRAAELPTR